MQFITLASPSVPTLPIGLMPIAANPIAAVNPPGADEGFASVIAGLGEDLELQPPPLPPAPGTALPPTRRTIAGPPEPLPAVEVEEFMVGSAAHPPAISAPMPAPVAPMPDSIVRNGQTLPEASGSVMSRAPAAPFVGPDCEFPSEVPFAVPQPAQRLQPLGTRRLPFEVPDEGAYDSNSMSASGSPRPNLEPVPEEYPAEPGLPVIAAPPQAPSPSLTPLPAPVFVPTNWVQPQPQIIEQPAKAPVAVIEPPVSNRPVPTLIPQLAGMSPSTVARPPKAGPEGPLPPVSVEDVGPASGAPAQPNAPTPTATPVFSLPPEFARQVARFVQSFASTNSDAPEAASESSAPIPAAAPVAQSQPVFTAAPQIAAPVQLGFVDTIRAEWVQAMIERIGEFAQADGKREAQIRLTPDTLGTIDVKIVERQDRLHVTLTTDNAQTRQLLSDAAPRLHELAEARGLKLGQTGVGGGEAQDRRPAPEQPPTPLRPRPISAGPDMTASTGELIA